jgi:hypothetical protein
MKVSFPGNLRVEARFGEFHVATDQPPAAPVLLPPAPAL